MFSLRVLIHTLLLTLVGWVAAWPACPVGRRSSVVASSSPCVWWYEEPDATRRVSTPFGRAQRGVEERLSTAGWRRRNHEEEDTAMTPRPSFTFEYPGAPTFCAYDPGALGPLRQLPSAWDDQVDDKASLRELLAADATLHDLTPPTFAVDRAFVASLGAGEGRWFLKHRLDAKRPRVHPYDGDALLAERLRTLKEQAWPYYVAQREIVPPMLVRGHKFVLRAHVLWWATDDATLRLFLHDDPLVSEHEAPSDEASLPALVLQSGARSPAYRLSDGTELSPLRASILAQMERTVAAVFRESQTQHPVPVSVAGMSSSSYQLYGLDFMLDAAGTVLLLEVNRSPRIATGAMGNIHECYTEMLLQAMTIMGVVTEPVGSKDLPGEFGVWRDVYCATL